MGRIRICKKILRIRNAAFYLHFQKFLGGVSLSEFGEKWNTIKNGAERRAFYG
jgi:hypothetical protein